MWGVKEETAEHMRHISSDSSDSFTWNATGIPTCKYVRRAKHARMHHMCNTHIPFPNFNYSCLYFSTVSH